jgi:hypothetical protein
VLHHFRRILSNFEAFFTKFITELTGLEEGFLSHPSTTATAHRAAAIFPRSPDDFIIQAIMMTMNRQARRVGKPT